MLYSLVTAACCKNKPVPDTSVLEGKTQTLWTVAWELYYSECSKLSLENTDIPSISISSTKSDHLIKAGILTQYFNK